jgi:hypothetical protein
MTAPTPITMSQAQLDAQTQSGALLAVDPSICPSGYSQAIGGCLDPVPTSSGPSLTTWLIGALIVGGLAWYFWPQITARISEWIPKLEAQQ